MHIIKYLVAASLAISLLGCTHNKNQYNYFAPPATGNSLVASPVATAYYPYQVKVYTYDQQPDGQYHQVGEIKVDQMNRFGFKRQQARIKTLLRDEAAVMGGDAIIIMPSDDKAVCKAQVIKYDQLEPKANSTSSDAKPTT